MTTIVLFIVTIFLALYAGRTTLTINLPSPYRIQNKVITSHAAGLQFHNRRYVLQKRHWFFFWSSHMAFHKLKDAEKFLQGLKEGRFTL